jgi:hypothetical protein
MTQIWTQLRWLLKMTDPGPLVAGVRKNGVRTWALRPG